MRIAATQFTLKDRAFEIYLSGCTIKCNGCHNPELWDFGYGDILSGHKLELIGHKINEANTLVQEIRILGGEPLDNDIDKLDAMLMYLNGRFPDKKLVLFTGYNLVDLESKYKYVFDVFDKIKFGRYVEELRVEDRDYASSNQGVWTK